MKLMIVLLSLFISLINGQLRCFHCESQPTLEACLINGRIDTCKSNERACATVVRRRGPDLLYFKTCKESHVCMNNKIQNLRAATTPTQCNVQGEGLICRCCCFFNECGRQENCTDARPEITPVDSETMPIVETLPEVCITPPSWEQGEVLCPVMHEQGGWEIGSECTYMCSEGFDLVGSQKTTCTRRRNKVTGDIVLEFFPSPPCCKVPCSTRLFADVVFVLDSSTSIGDENWQRILTFVQSIAEKVPVSLKGVRFGLITYGHRIIKEWELPFYRSNTYQEFIYYLQETPYISKLYGTVTATALRYTAEHVFTSAFGSRPDTDKIVVFVTDGRSTEDAEDLLEAANQLKSLPTRVFAVGINLDDEESVEEINLIASSPDDVSIIGYNELTGETLLQQITNFVCNQSCSTQENPPERCELPPIWRGGDVHCPPQTGSGWRIGEACEYICPQGYELIGNRFSTCEQNIDPQTDQTTLLFSSSPPCCEPPCTSIIVADIVFVLDSSTSIGLANWRKILQFIETISAQVPVSRERVQFGLIIYGERVYTEWNLPLNSSRSNEQFIEKVNETPYIAEDYGTITASALHYTAEHAFTPEFGYRPDVKNRYVIFITDGMTSDEEVAELPAAIDELNKVVEKVYAVGINVENSIELYQIATTPQDVSYIGFDELTAEDFLSDIMTFVCSSLCRR